MGKRFNFSKYVKYANHWLKSKKKRPLTIDEEDILYSRLNMVAIEYDENAEQYDLMTVLCITAAEVVMELHPDVKDELERRVKKVASRIKKK
jgi:hypothetical protein